MFIEIFVQATDPIDSGKSVHKRLTIRIDGIQSLQESDEPGECFMTLTTGEDYIVCTSYENMIKLWHKAVDLSNESFIIRADTTNVKELKSGMN